MDYWQKKARYKKLVETFEKSATTYIIKDGFLQTITPNVKRKEYDGKENEQG